MGPFPILWGAEFLPKPRMKVSSKNGFVVRRGMFFVSVRVRINLFDLWALGYVARVHHVGGHFAYMIYLKRPEYNRIRNANFA